MATTTKPKGWGVGYLDNNVSGGFNNFADPTALQNEINRMDSVMKNRTAQKMGNTAQQNYYNQLKSYAPVNPDQYKTQSATIQDISSKYGFDFSRDYAKRQAEAEAQAKRNAVADAQRKNASNKTLNLKSIDNNLMSAAEGLDHNYFQKYQQQQQAQVNGGLNGGIAADQDLRMAMARQAAMGDAYRDANLGRMQENQRFTNDDLRLAEELGLINQSALAREDSLFNDRLMQGAGLAQETDRFNLSQNGMLLDAAMQNRATNLSAVQNARDYARSVLESDRGFNYQTGRDKVADSQWAKEYSRILGRDKRSDFESDRGYSRGVLESDRDYARRILESDRGYGLDKQRLAASQSSYAPPGALNSDPKSKDQSYADWIGFFNTYKGVTNSKSLQDQEKKILKERKMYEDQGYNIQAVIDAMYAGATDGFYRSKKDYTESLNRKNKEWAAIGVQAMR